MSNADLKFCVDCKFFKDTYNLPMIAICTAIRYDFVTGDEIGDRQCWEVRAKECGATGVYFQLRGEK